MVNSAHVGEQRNLRKQHRGGVGGGGESSMRGGGGSRREGATAGGLDVGGGAGEGSGDWEEEEKNLPWTLLGDIFYMKARSATKYVIVLGVLVHFVYLACLFDTYFTSPLVSGIPAVEYTEKAIVPFHEGARGHPDEEVVELNVSVSAPAKRVVLFVADGLRADKFFEMDHNGKTRAPYLREKIEQKGTWGISHTRVPTESRPGHVALIGGFYEDVSAVTRGWKENPTNFDSVFNESRYTWSWGSPDIVPMFSRDDFMKTHIFTEVYEAEEEDFAGADASQLDTWVFDKVTGFFEGAKKNESLAAQLQGDKNVFFLHLLGIDTNGHAHLPYSHEYLDNIKVVDKGIEKMVQVIEDYFGDKSTAYVFTSDHGMSNTGSHGGGHPDETQTPILAWGAGVTEPVARKTNEMCGHDSLSTEWRLAHLCRRDIKQADVAALMTGLIGSPFPVHNVGVLPLEYLDAGDEYRMTALYANTLQILAQYQKKALLKENSRLYFYPFEELKKEKYIELEKIIVKALKEKNYELVKAKCNELTELSLKGLSYFQTYDRPFLMTCATLGYTGWGLLIAMFILRHYTTVCVYHLNTKFVMYQAVSQHIGSDIWLNSVFTTAGAFFCLFLFLQSAPCMYYIYVLLPVFLWCNIFKRRFVLYDVYRYAKANNAFGRLIILMFIYGFGLELLVYAFFRREIISLGFIILAVWPYTTSLWATDTMTLVGWTICCTAGSIFPLIPVDVGEMPELVVFSAVAVSLFSLFSVTRPYFHLMPKSKSDVAYCSSEKQKTFLLTSVQIGLILLSAYIVWDTSINLRMKRGLPRMNQALSWIILCGSVYVARFSSHFYLTRMMSLTLGTAPAFLLLALSFEGLFFSVLIGCCFFWFMIEHKLSPTRLRSEGAGLLRSSKPKFILDSSDFKKFTRNITSSDVRTSFFFLYFVEWAFFGLGNIASVSSFNPASTYRFVTVFSPFIMASLCLIKIIIPFLVVFIAFNAVNQTLHVPTISLFLCVIVMSDVMALHFFFLVKDYGSWQEIGTSISHFVIASALIVFLLLLYAITKWLTGELIIPSSKKLRELHSHSQ
eukprot:Nk52_evm20s2340 gene=Nk52_evmTU20s2340